MDMTWQAILWDQFGAAIDMLENALRACPDELWQARLYEERTLQPDFAAFWFLGYHTLFWLDYYLSDAVKDFAPPDPFTLSELDPAGLLPERAYTKDELLAYLEYGRSKCRTRIESLADEKLTRSKPDWPEMSVAGSLLYNMRHVQEHAAQLSLFLGQQAILAPGWVARTRSQASAE